MPPLVQPIRPTPNTVKPPLAPQSTPTTGSLEGSSASTAASTPQPRDTKYSDLDADEKEQLRQLNDEYLYNRRAYDKQTEALAKLRSKI